MPRIDVETGGLRAAGGSAESVAAELRGFAGEIAAGEYGGGHVTIWDAGRYATEKWDERHIIVTFDGRRLAVVTTAEVIAMRGLGDPDAFPATDLGVRLAAKQLGLPEDARALTERSSRWRPWRSYATQHLWTALDHSVNAWPPKEK
jgi:hypothetical protein